MTRNARIRAALAVAALLYAARGFFWVGVMQAIQLNKGDFRAIFPTQALAWLRQDFPTTQVWDGWTYGPMSHALTLPLFLAPRWSLVGPIWMLVNLAALTSSFVAVYRLSGVDRRVTWPSIVTLVAMWLWFRPLRFAFADGNVELIEMAVTLWALVAFLRGQSHRTGILLGIATMIKFAPIGFLGWLGLRRDWRAVATGVVTIAIVAAFTQVSLGWQHNVFLDGIWDRGVPLINADTQSLTSIFLHAAGRLDYSDPFFLLRWFPDTRARIAAESGALACLVLAMTYGVLLVLRRRRPVSRIEMSALMLPMFLLLPHNHQYYYVFALVPFSVLFLKAVADRRWGLLSLIVLAYFMMAMPTPTGALSLNGFFGVPVFYIRSYSSIMVYGALLLWATATYQMLKEPGARPLSPRAVKTRRLVLWAVPSSAVIIIALSGWRTTQPPDMKTTAMMLAPSIALDAPDALALSPDGSKVAYISDEHNLCARDLSALAAVCWSGHEQSGNLAFEPASPFFSPDGRWIGFFSRGEPRKVRASGGAPQSLSAMPAGQSGSWGDDDLITFSTPAGIFRIPADPATGTEQLLVRHQTGEGPYRSPIQIGGEIVFEIAPLAGANGAGHIAAYSLATGRRQTLFAGSQLRVDRTRSNLIYFANGCILSTPILSGFVDSAIGASVPLACDVLTTAEGGAVFDIGNDGALVHLPAADASVAQRRLTWVARGGTRRTLPIPANAFESPRLSPDGQTLAVTIRDTLTDVWTFDVNTGAPRRISTSGSQNDSSVWIDDGDAVAFFSSGSSRIWPAVFASRIADVDRQPIKIWTDDIEGRPSDAQPSMVRRGSAFFSQRGPMLPGARQSGLWLLDVSGSANAAQRPTGSVIAPAEMRHPVISPDGRWLAYESSADGQRGEIYVESFPVRGARRQLSVAGGSEPVWSHDGTELFFLGSPVSGSPLAILSVSVGHQVRLAASAPRLVLADVYKVPEGQQGTSYDVSADGQHFVIMTDGVRAKGASIKLMRDSAARLAGR